ncbi:MAG: hypothetical protein IPH44_12575 [Myxococcales bacterium]|jgi:hypothetical protein|nr:hypothetical protein [Myxococcales bacterium]MBK7194113.1 hypothetical protein [Myxococcales bacterium]MBP6842532.1 hypothetical protein [Kofleriaceae bacterium]
MWILRALPLALVLAACGGKSTPPVDKPGDGSGSAPPPITIDTSKLGSACGEGDACPDGLMCARYFGIAGPSGPEFTSCEIACDTGQACPEGTACVTIADGPGAVCRATEGADAPPPVAE